MTDQTKQKLKYWLIGILTGGAVAAPVTAVICKNIYEDKIEEAKAISAANAAKSEENAYNKGMNDMAEYAVAQMRNDDDGIPDAETIDKYDLSIDDEAASEEARERTLERERYLDMIDKYNGTQMNCHIISVEDFESQNYTEKSYVNWYDQDDVFEEELSVIQDPYETFGVMSGQDLFKDTDHRPDPNIVYVRNEKKLTDFEITRIHGAYSVMVGGEQSLGETDT
jgi:hypothetical protein